MRSTLVGINHETGLTQWVNSWGVEKVPKILFEDMFNVPVMCDDNGERREVKVGEEVEILF